MPKDLFSYQLSICMMVRDEAHNLHRCFSSMSTLLKRDDVELIVIDTGSADESSEIAKQYTEKTYFHRWNNHFSEMRNKTISYAKGEWILIIDADELFVDDNQLCEYLDADTLKNYATVQLTSKNYVSSDLSKSIMTPLVRMFRNEKSLKFIGSIHNQPQFKKPILNSSIMYEHHGYYNDDKELMEKKFKRTSTLLKKEIEKDPTNIYYLFQLAKSYSMHKEKEDAYRQIKKAYRVMKDKKVEHLYVYHTYASEALNYRSFMEAAKVAEEGLYYQPEYIDLCFIRARSLFFLNEFEEAVKNYEQFLSLYKRGEKLSVFTDPRLEISFYDEKSKITAKQELVSSYIFLNQLDKAEAVLAELSLNESKCVLMTRLYSNKENFGDLAEFYIEFIEEEHKKAVEKEIENQREKLSADKLKNQAEAFQFVDGAYGRLNRFRLLSLTNNYKDTSEIQSFFEENEISLLPSYYYDIFEYAAENGYLIVRELKKIASNVSKLIVQTMFDEEKEASKMLKDHLFEGKKPRSNDFHGTRTFTAIANVWLLLQAEKHNKEELIANKQAFALFDQYTEIGIQYMKMLYQCERFQQIHGTIDDNEHKMLIMLSLYREAMQKGNIKKAFEYYKTAAKVYPFMSKYLDIGMADVHFQLGDFYLTQGEHRSALEMYESFLLQTENEEKQEMVLEKIQFIEMEELKSDLIH